MLVPVWYDDAQLGDGLRMSVGDAFCEVLRHFGSVTPIQRSAPMTEVQSFNVEGDNISALVSIERLIGTAETAQIVVTQRQNVSIVANSATAHGSQHLAGGLGVETWGDEFDLDAVQAASGIVRRLELIERWSGPEHRAVPVPVRHEVPAITRDSNMRSRPSVDDCELLAHVELDIS